MADRSCRRAGGGRPSGARHLQATDVPGDDELSALADLINRTLDALELGRGQNDGPPTRRTGPAQSARVSALPREERERRQIAVEAAREHREGAGRQPSSSWGTWRPGSRRIGAKELEAVRAPPRPRHPRDALANVGAQPARALRGSGSRRPWSGSRAGARTLRLRMRVPRMTACPSRSRRTFRAIVFRAVRELLLNVSKHARATNAKVWVSLTRGRRTRPDRGRG